MIKGKVEIREAVLRVFVASVLVLLGASGYQYMYVLLIVGILMLGSIWVKIFKKPGNPRKIKIRGDLNLIGGLLLSAGAIFALFIADEKIKEDIPKYLDYTNWLCLLFGGILLFLFLIELIIELTNEKKKEPPD